MSLILNYNLVCILGPTASGKTAFAANLANRLGGEIISADSRQVYRNMNLGTGKDLDDYIVNGIRIPFHLIDIADAGFEYNVFQFQKDFLKVFEQIRESKKLPILCGGTGLYIESILRSYKLINVPADETFRKELGLFSMEELEKRLRSYRKLHNTTDINIRKRLIRAIEIEEYYVDHPDEDVSFPELRPVVLGIMIDRDSRRRLITERLIFRLQHGMIEEVQNLLNSGITPDKLAFYGLEYKYLTWYVTGKMSYGDMFVQLNTAIHQFAKRQMTWFRKMEREGIKIHWIDGDLEMEEKLKIAEELVAGG